MTASQMRIAETIDAFYGDAGTKDGVSRSYKQAVEDLDAETIKALDGPYRYAIDQTSTLPPHRSAPSLTPTFM
jgi:bridging integrator 3